MSHKHYNINSRICLFLCLQAGKSYSQIAEETGFSKSAICQEIKRNSSLNGYEPIVAQAIAEERQRVNKKPYVLEIYPELKEKIQYFISVCHYSPDQIAGSGCLGNVRISYKTIYNWINKNMLNFSKKENEKSELKRHLRHKGKPRHKKGTVDNRGKFSIENTIHDRPKEANQRQRIGDWEADTVLGKQGHSCILTLTDRKTKFLIAEKIKSKSAGCIIEKLKEIFKKLPKNKLLTVTPDNGKEFAHYKEAENEFGIKFHFADPGCPGQRGINENTNGLLREFIPKGTEINNITNEVLHKYVNLINNRLRKILGYQKPEDIFSVV